MEGYDGSRVVGGGGSRSWPDDETGPRGYDSKVDIEIRTLTLVVLPWLTKYRGGRREMGWDSVRG